MQLDAGMLVEALILERLNALPKRRHQDWIRSLLVQGFLAESRVLRQIDGAMAENRFAAPDIRTVLFVVSFAAQMRGCHTRLRSGHFRIVSGISRPGPCKSRSIVTQMDRSGNSSEFLSKILTLFF